MNRISRGFLIAASILCTAGVVQAELFTVHLQNGSTFETRYRPRVSPEQPGMVMMLTDMGNWIALPEDAITDVTSETETKGFGRVIDTTTIALGIAPNEREVGDEAQQMDTNQILMSYLRAQQQRQNQDFSVQQFADPGDLGTGGIPIGFTGTTTPPMGGGDMDNLDVIDN